MPPEDLTFTSPYDDHIDRASYFERCWPNSELVREIRIEKLFEKDGEVLLRYELETLGAKNSATWSFCGPLET